MNSPLPAFLRYTPARYEVYQALLAEPRRSWTASELAEHTQLPVSVCRDIIYLLESAKVVRRIPLQRGIRLALRTDAVATLTPLVHRWQQHYPRSPMTRLRQ